MLLHLLLRAERESAIADAFNVIARDSTPALCGRLYRCFKRRAGLGDQTGLGKLNVLVRAIPVKRFAAMFQFEADGASACASMVEELTILSRSCDAQVIRRSQLRGKNAHRYTSAPIFFGQFSAAWVIAMPTMLWPAKITGSVCALAISQMR
jgi:hypothetical protein